MDSAHSDKDRRDRIKVLATTLASPLSSVISKYACHPFDTIKSKVQARATHLHGLSEYKVGHSFELGTQEPIQSSKPGRLRESRASSEESLSPLSAPSSPSPPI